MRRRWLVLMIVMWGMAIASASAEPPGLLFHVSFDRQNATADCAAGDGRSSLQSDLLGFHSAPGVKGAGMLLQPGERCTYPIAGNLDTSQGTFSCWVKPMNWDGHGKKFRHILVVTAGPQYTMLVYLYGIADDAVFNYIHLYPKTPNEATWRAGAPVDILKRNEWTHLVTTWDGKALRVYANAKRVGEGIVAYPLPKLQTGTFTLCPVEWWKHKMWSDPNEQTVCDEVRIFGRVLADDEILDLYAQDVPGSAQGLAPALALEVTPDYPAKTIALTARAAHLDKTWKERMAAGATLKLTVRDAKNTECLSYTGPLGEGQFTARVPEWVDGDYVAEGVLSAGGADLAARATVSKPPTPWLPPQKDWRADRVLPPWTPLARRDEKIVYWNGEIALDGALPSQITSKGAAILAGPIRLVADAPATWEAMQITEEKPFRITRTGTGRLGGLSASYQTLVEFDGLIRSDITLAPPAAGADLPSLTFEVPLRAEVAAYYRNPICREWDGKSLDEPQFLPYSWLGNEDRGLSWFMESAANWHMGTGQPAITIRREGDSVTARLRVISEPTRIAKPVTYTIGFEATPVRPLPERLYDWRFGSGPQTKGVNLFVYGWGQQISYLSGRLIAHDPAEQRKLVDKWRAQGTEALSYTCAQCTANLSPEYLFFGQEWNQPYGGTFSGYKRVPDNAPYSMVPVCPQSSFADFLVWCVQENVRNDWSGGIYTDIDGAVPCDNAAHGCGFTDAFGQTGRAWPLYAHRGLSRRIYQACHDAGKVYFSHCHSNWFSLFNAFNDGWCPGEQFSSAVIGKPHFYMDEMPDRVWRSEFYSPTTGAATYLLPELGRLEGREALKDRGPSESCIVAAMCHGVPLWAGGINSQVVEEVWAAQKAFGIAGAEFVPFWRQQELTCPDPQVRVSLWKKAGERLVVIANFSGEDKQATLRPATANAAVKFEAMWKGADLRVADGAAVVTVSAKNGALLRVTGMP